MEPNMNKIWQHYRENKRQQNVKEYSNKFFKNLNKKKHRRK